MGPVAQLRLVTSARHLWGILVRAARGPSHDWAVAAAGTLVGRVSAQRSWLRVLAAVALGTLVCMAGPHFSGRGIAGSH